MTSMFIKGKKQDSLRIRLLKIRAIRAKNAMESASNSHLDSISMTNEEEAEDNNMCQVGALDLTLPRNSNNAQTSTDSGPANPSSPTLSSVEQQELNSQVQNQTQSYLQPSTSNSVAACHESEQDRLSPPSPVLFEPLEPPNSPMSFFPPNSPEPDQRCDTPDSMEPCHSPEPPQLRSWPDPTEPIYDSVPPPPRPIYTNTQQVQTERELNSEQEPACAQPNTHQRLVFEKLFPSQQNPCIYSVNELEQSAENLPLQRVQELQALGNILFLVGRSMSGIASLYDLLLKPGVDFQRDADTRSIFTKGYSSIILNLDSANNIMHGIDFSKCFEKK